MTALTLTDRPKSVRNRCVTKFLGRFFNVDTLLLGFFCGCRGFCHILIITRYMKIMCMRKVTEYIEGNKRRNYFCYFGYPVRTRGGGGGLR